VERCSQCVLPLNTPGVTFENGVCGYCRNRSTITYRGEQELLSLLHAQRARGKRYDCIVCVSGGRDSCYTLLSLVRDYGMKVLAVNYQNPLTDPQARKNIANAVRILGVDLVEFRLPNQLHERTFRDVANGWLRNPSPALVPMHCMACKVMYRNIVQIARRHDVRCIVNGGNRFEDVSFKKVLLGLTASVKAEDTITAAWLGLLKQSFRHRAYFKPYMLPVVALGYLFADPYTLGSRLLGRGIRRIDLFHFVPWQEDRILSRLRSELDWDCPPDFKATWRFDCRFGRLKDWMYTLTLGLTERDDLYSSMVRNGAMSRDEALRRLAQEGAPDVEYVERMYAEFGVDPTLVRQAMVRAEKARGQAGQDER
jgi:hypothetical protein